MSDIRQMVQDIGDSVAAQTAALDLKVEEQRVMEIVEENLSPIYDELEAQGKRKFEAPENRQSAPSRERALVGTRFEHLDDVSARRDWNADDVEFLHDMLAMAKDYRKGPGPSEELRNLYKDIRTSREMTPQQRAMDTAESGYGSQLVGAQYVSQLWSGAREVSVLFNLLPTFEMTAPTAYLPVAAAPPEMLYVSENTASDASNYTTSKTGSNRVTVTAGKFLIHQMWSGEMQEDSIIPYIPFLRGQAAWSVGYYSDSVVLNGDTTNAGTGNINLDDADPADTKHYLALDGLRHIGLADNTNNQKDQAAAPTYKALLLLRKQMIDRTYLMDWGHPINPMDLIYVCSPEDSEEIANLDETITVDKYGSQAVVLNGEVTKVGRHPVVRTIAMSLTEADGKVSTTAANNTKGQIILFNRNGFAVGWRRRLTMKTEDIPATDQYRIVYSLRMGLGRYSPTGAASGIEAATVMFDITLS